MSIPSVKNQDAQAALVVNQPSEQSSAAKTVQIAQKLSNHIPIYYEGQRKEYKEKIFRDIVYNKGCEY